MFLPPSYVRLSLLAHPSPFLLDPLDFFLPFPFFLRFTQLRVLHRPFCLFKLILHPFPFRIVIREPLLSGQFYSEGSVQRRPADGIEQKLVSLVELMEFVR